MAFSVTEIPGCKVEVQAPDFAIISYPFIDGSHHPSSARQFVALVEQLSSLHNRGLVHGDVRASNIVFGDGTANLIDFDFAGKADDKLYPEGFVTDAKLLGDVARHRSAQAGKELKPEHDWFSLGTVMEFVEPEDSKGIPRWQEVVCKLKAVEVLDNVADVLKVLRAMDKTPLKLAKNLTPATATGSPPRKGEKSKKSH
jgi:serine/threonine protein kinase